MGALTAQVKVKICGVTRLDDVIAACAGGADFIGFNFYPKSPRYVTPAQAKELREHLPDGVRAVGVFVNASVTEVEEITRVVGLDLVQFHGDESVDTVAPLASKAIRAIRVDPDCTLSEVDHWSSCWGVLFDTPAANLYGGSGEEWAYSRVKAVVARNDRTFLAGGLAPGNVARAVSSLPGLYAVDVCSGVESSPGLKDQALLDDFFRQVKSVS